MQCSMLLAFVLNALAKEGSSPAGAPQHLVSLPLHHKMQGQRSNGQRFTVERLSERPHTFLLHNFLSEEECNALISSAKKAGFETAETTGKSDARRRCDAALLSPSTESVLAAVQSDAARTLLSEEALTTPGGGCEELNVLRYQPGGEYQPQCVTMPKSSMPPSSVADHACSSLMLQLRCAEQPAHSHHSILSKREGSHLVPARRWQSHSLCEPRRGVGACKLAGPCH